MVNKKIKRKVLKKEVSKKKFSRDYRSEGKNILVGLLGFFLTVFLVQFSYKGPDEGISLNVVQVVDFFSAQMLFLVSLPRFIATIFGVIIAIIPFVFFYFLSKEIFGRRG